VAGWVIAGWVMAGWVMAGWVMAGWVMAGWEVRETGPLARHRYDLGRGPRVTMIAK
jgi:hypothetical protein